MSGFKYFRLQSVRFRRGRGEMSKVCFDLRWGRSGTVVGSVAAYCSFEPQEGALRGGHIFLSFWPAYPFEQCKQYFWVTHTLS